MNSFDDSQFTGRNQASREPDERESDYQGDSATLLPPHESFEGFNELETRPTLPLNEDYFSYDPQEDPTTGQPHGPSPLEGPPQSRPQSHSSLYHPSADLFTFAAPANRNPWNGHNSQHGLPSTVDRHPDDPFEHYGTHAPAIIPPSNYPRRLYGGVHPGTNAQLMGLGQVRAAPSLGTYPRPIYPQQGYGGAPALGNPQPAELGQLYGGTPAMGYAQLAGLGQPQAVLPPTANPPPQASQPRYGGFQSLFTNRQAALQHLDSVKWRPETAHTADPSFPTSHAEIERHAMAVYDALINVENIEDRAKSTHAEGFRSAKYSQADVEARAYQVVQAALDLHERGSTLREGLDDTKPRSFARRWKFDERMRRICAALRVWKTMCVDIMDGSKLQQLVNNVQAMVARRSSNQKNNENKRLILEEGYKVRKRKAETQPETESADEEESGPTNGTTKSRKKAKIRAQTTTQSASTTQRAAAHAVQGQRVNAEARHDSAAGPFAVAGTQESTASTVDAQRRVSYTEAPTNADARRNLPANYPYYHGPGAFYGYQGPQLSQPLASPAGYTPAIQGMYASGSGSRIDSGAVPTALSHTRTLTPARHARIGARNAQFRWHTQQLGPSTTSASIVRTASALHSTSPTGGADGSTTPANTPTTAPAGVPPAQNQHGLYSPHRVSCSQRFSTAGPSASASQALGAPESTSATLGADGHHMQTTLPAYPGVDTVSPTPNRRRSSGHEASSTSPSASLEQS